MSITKVQSLTDKHHQNFILLLAVSDPDLCLLGSGPGDCFGFLFAEVFLGEKDSFEGGCLGFLLLGVLLGGEDSLGGDGEGSFSATLEGDGLLGGEGSFSGTLEGDGLLGGLLGGETSGLLGGETSGLFGGDTSGILGGETSSINSSS